ncbi:MAG: 1-phosphofructokinase family hexose kinase [Candidatus Thermoplasmatota archaeon]
MKNVVTLTMNPAVDMNSKTNIVSGEEKLRCEKPTFNPGGGGINISRVLKKLGGDLKAFYPAGGDTGEILKNLLDEENICHQPIAVDSRTRINVSIIESETGRQFRFNMPGSKLTEEEWHGCLDIILNLDPSPDFLVASGSLPPGVPKEFYKKLAEVSKEKNCKLILDSSGQPLQYALEEGVFLIKPNLREFTHLMGEPLKDEAQIEKHAKKIVNSGQSQVVIISLGPAGVLLIDSEDGYKHICSPITPIDSRVGAGDSMVAGITFKLSEGISLEESVYYGVAAGAAAVMTPGTELCRKEDVERLFNTIYE